MWWRNTKRQLSDKTYFTIKLGNLFAMKRKPVKMIWFTWEYILFFHSKHSEKLSKPKTKKKEIEKINVLTS